MSISISNFTHREQFLPRYFRDCFFDIYIYAFAERMFKGYDGGKWNFVTAQTENGIAAFLTPIVEGDSVVLANIFSGEESEVDPILAGMILTTFAMEHQINTNGRRDLLEGYDLLKNTVCQYCSEHSRMDAWMTLMD